MQLDVNALSFIRKPLTQFIQNQQPVEVRRMGEEDAKRLPPVAGQDRVQIGEGIYADMTSPDSTAQMGEAIYTKLQAGQALTDEEMAWLRTNNPEMYQKALLIKLEREMYKKELENCLSKEDVAKVQQRKMQTFCSQASDILGSSMSKEQKLEAMDFLEMRRKAVENEHQTFIESNRYKQLPQKRKKDDEDKEALELKENEEYKRLDAKYAAMAPAGAEDAQAAKDTQQAGNGGAQPAAPVAEAGTEAAGPPDVAAAAAPPPEPAAGTAPPPEAPPEYLPLSLLV